jgi:hypothetical protein
MEMLDDKTISAETLEQFQNTSVYCGPRLWCGVHFWCRWLDWCGIRLTCGPRLWQRLEDGLKACSSEFFIRCPGFDRIGPECNFELAFDAQEWKQKVEIEKLQTRIETLEARIKKMG